MTTEKHYEDAAHDAAQDPISSWGVDTDKLKPSATPPFNGPKCDIILKTADNVHFFVWKLILDIAAPDFKGFTIPDWIIHGKEFPIFMVDESSMILDLLLRFCYPVKPPQLVEQDATVIGNVLTAANKLGVNVAREAALEALKERANISAKDALIAYAIACQQKLDDVARAAAIACLNWPLPGPKVSQLSFISGMDYYNLVQFHRSVCDVVVGLFHQWQFNTTTCAAIQPFSHNCKDDKRFRGGAPEWWTLAQSKLRDAAKAAPLDTSTITLAAISTDLETHGCPTCIVKATRGWQSTKEAIIAVMKEKVDEVELAVSWK